MVVGMRIGEGTLPRLRVFEQVAGAAEAGDEEQEGEPRMREWEVEVASQIEVILSEEQRELERELKIARGGGEIAVPVGRVVRSFVLPR